MTVLFVRFNDLTELKTTHDALLAESTSGPSIVFIVKPQVGLSSMSINNGLDSRSRRHAALQELAATRLRPLIDVRQAANVKHWRTGIRR